MNRINILVVLTHGWVPIRQAPTNNGIDRLKKMMVEDIRSSKNFFHEIAIIGGWPDKNGVTFAAHYKQWFHAEYARGHKITIIDDRTNNTVDDLKGLHEILKQKYHEGNITLFVVTSKMHYLRVWRTIRKLGFKSVHIASNEKGSSVPGANFILRAVQWSALFLLSLIDPLHEGALAGFLRKKADTRAEEYRKTGRFA